MRPIRLSSRRRRGAALLISLIFIMVFSTLAVSLASMSGTNVQLAYNHSKVNGAFAAAQSGLECGKYICATVTLPSTGQNMVSDSEASQVWSDLCQHLINSSLDGQTVNPAGRFTDAIGSGDEISTPMIDCRAGGAQFFLRLYRYDAFPKTVIVESTGVDGDVTRTIQLQMPMSKANDVMNYAVASGGRMWLTGDTTIEGDIFSTWDRPEISPYNMTSDSSIIGTINTVLTLDQIKNENYKLETLDPNDNPMFDQNGDRIYSADDEVQAYHEGINYGQSSNNMPGMDISDYDTRQYNNGLTDIPYCPSEDREVEYFPHAIGDYSMPRDGTPGNTWNRRLERHVYKNQIFSNVRLPDNRNALFRNCSFYDILYIDCYRSAYSYYNNVRFEDCTFHGVIVTDVPQVLKWQYNCLYFTGTAQFDNTSDIQEATILAPHFNVNLGNTNPVQSEYNQLTGAVVGGIVDVRGNAQIEGTIISMCDTTQWSSGYVTNIGATLNDGGSETTTLGDVGTISITPKADAMLPSGITSPIVLRPDLDSYVEL